MSAYIVYYDDRVTLVYNHKPRPENYPGSRFAEGPFKNKDECVARLGWMGMRR